MPGSLSLLDLDADLAQSVPADELGVARHATAVQVGIVKPGPWPAAASAEKHDGILGFFVVDGAVVRELVVGPNSLPELLGAGEPILPPVGGFAVIRGHVRLIALRSTRVAVLGGHIGEAAARWPGVGRTLQRRLTMQQERAAALGAICQMPRVELRVLALLGLLAEQWGRVGPDGVTIPLELTHESLGRFIGAKRPTVTLAVKTLREQGLVMRCPDGTWMLSRESQEVLADALAAPRSGPPEIVHRVPPVAGYGSDMDSDRSKEIRPGSGAGLGPEPEAGDIAGGTGMVERGSAELRGQRVGMVLDSGSPRAREAFQRLASALGGATVGEPDSDGVFDVTVLAESWEAGLQRVWDAVAAAGADDHVRFAEHPDLPEHWRRVTR